jgi:hypothetical protein
MATTSFYRKKPNKSSTAIDSLIRGKDLNKGGKKNLTTELAPL